MDVAGVAALPRGWDRWVSAMVVLVLVMLMEINL
jgi:hypothetical protein